MKIFLGTFLLCTAVSIAQTEMRRNYSLEGSYFYGSIIEHNPHIGHLITHNPEGLILSLNRKTYGFETWEGDYNYPDVGFSFTYQNMKNPYLGENFGLYAHLGFYFLKRNLVLKVGQGVALTTNPYHPERNIQNVAYGSRLMSSTFFSGNFQKENIYEGFGFQAGISLVHYSNADFKSPNNSTNTLALNAGLNYLFDYHTVPVYIPRDTTSYSEPIHYNLAIRSGVNTIGIPGSKVYPFLTISAYADKRINRRSTLQAGAEFFLSRSMEKYIEYRPGNAIYDDTTGDEDARRVGIFAGHQLTFNRVSFITQLGYFVYYPYDKFGGRIYNRIGLQRQLYRNLFGSISILAQGTNAEAFEFSLGYRF